MNASINSIIIVLPSVGGLYRCHCWAQPPHIISPDSCWNRYPNERLPTLWRRFNFSIKSVCEVWAVWDHRWMCSTLSTFPLSREAGSLKLKRWPQICHETIYSWARTHNSLYILTQSAFPRNLSIFSWTEPEARINTATPQCWSQFLLQIFKSDLKGLLLLHL